VSAATMLFPFPTGAKGVADITSWSKDQGVDIAAPGGTPLLAVGSGTIVQEGISGFGPWAPILKLDAPINGMQYVYYGHAGPDLVSVGTHVAAGQQISEVGYGQVGISTGPHLEFGMMPTQAIPAVGQTSNVAQSLLEQARDPAGGSALGASPGGGILGSGIGPNVGPDLNPVDAISSAFSSFLSWLESQLARGVLYALLIGGGVALAGYGLVKTLEPTGIPQAVGRAGEGEAALA